jgi:hypothetical protein
MADKPTVPDDKPVRVYFGEATTARDIAIAIQKIQDNWALKFPERAHRLYPTVYNADRTRVNPRK